MTLCPYCGGSSVGNQRLCGNCLLGLTKYWDQNQIIVDAYVNEGVCAMAVYLTHWAEFMHQYPDTFTERSDAAT